MLRQVANAQLITQTDGARIRFQLTRHDAQQSRLPCPVGSDDTHLVLGTHIERHAVQDGFWSKMLDDVLNR